MRAEAAEALLERSPTVEALDWNSEFEGIVAANAANSPTKLVVAEAVGIVLTAECEIDVECTEVKVVSDLPEEASAREKAEQLIHVADMLGPIAVRTSVEKPKSESEQDEAPARFTSMLDAIKSAAEGNVEARKLIETNVRTDMVERTIKAGHVMKVDMEVDTSGNIVQHGQTMEDVFINAIRFASDLPQMRERAEAEVRNGMRMHSSLQQGHLEDNYFVVISRCADNMTPEELEKCGFFRDAMSCSIQALTLKDGKLVQESGFVAGVKRRGKRRHDKRAVIGMTQELGVDFSGMNDAEMLDTPLLIPKEMMPNGVVDVIERYDDAAGGTFFGQRKPRQDYKDYLEFCRQREADMEPNVQKVVDELLQVKDLFEPLDAVKKLHELSEKYMVEYAVEDESIDPRVFGAVSAEHIKQARVLLSQGDTERYRQALLSAQATAVSSSCPTAMAARAAAAAAAGESLDADGLPISSDASTANRKNWKTKIGMCIIKGCPTRPGKTKVGPCGICMDRCQELFDKGGDPTGGARFVPLKPRKKPDYLVSLWPSRKALRGQVSANADKVASDTLNKE